MKNQESATLRALMSGSNLSLYQADFMLSVLRPDSSASVLLSPGRKKNANNLDDHEEEYDFGFTKRPCSATREYHKKPNDDVQVIETFDRPSSLVFPWQAQMFTSEWNKIVSKSCTLSNGGVSGSGNEPEDEGK